MLRQRRPEYLLQEGRRLVSRWGIGGRHWIMRRTYPSTLAARQLLRKFRMAEERGNRMATAFLPVMANLHHKALLLAKQVIYGKRGEPYRISGQTLRFVPGTRPVRMHYANS